jgi:hypothetical protein
MTTEYQRNKATYKARYQRQKKEKTAYDKEKARQYYLENREHILKRQKKYNMENQDKIKRYNYFYFQENKHTIYERLKSYKKALTINFIYDNSPGVHYNKSKLPEHHNIVTFI